MPFQKSRKSVSLQRLIFGVLLLKVTRNHNFAPADEGFRTERFTIITKQDKNNVYSSYVSQFCEFLELPERKKYVRCQFVCAVCFAAPFEAAADRLYESLNNVSFQLAF